MKKHILTLAAVCFAICHLHAQNIAINTSGGAANSSAILDLNTGNNYASPNGKGLLIPNVSLSSTTDVTTIATPANSLLVYNTNAAMAGGAVGYWYYNTSIPKWVSLGGSGGLDWSLLGNAGTVDGTNFIGTTDAIAFNIRMSNQRAGRIDLSGNSFFGYQAGNTGTYNTAIGIWALQNNTVGGNTAVGTEALQTNSTGLGLVAIGENALLGNTTGNNNTATGVQALTTNSTANFNTANGYQALMNNNGPANTALGYAALQANTSGQDNTAVGAGAMLYSNTASQNTACGENSLYYTTGVNNTGLGCYAGLGGGIGLATGTANTAVGVQALQAYTSGSSNTATGSNSLFSNTSGSNNTAIGTESLDKNTTGANNVGLGTQAGYTNISGSGNLFLGYNAGYNELGSDKLYISNSNTITPLIYGDFAAGAVTINGGASNWATRVNSPNTANSSFGLLTVAGTSATDYSLLVMSAAAVSLFAVYGDGHICASGNIGAASFAACSDIRYKKEITPLNNTLSNVLKMQGVNYFWKKDEFPEKNFSDKQQIGFIAQELEKIYPEIIQTDDKGYKSVDYSRLTPVLVEAIKEQQKQIEKLEARSQKSEEENADLKTEIKIINHQLSIINSQLGTKAEK